ncbi:NAD-dependent dehydratase [Synergistales bacterium]|nr:NAD-dependent dehydratase [Synergistales bacterium]
MKSKSGKSLKIFITGINGFIGSHLTEAIFTQTDWRVSGFDMRSDNLDELLRSDNFVSFKQGDIFDKEYRAYIKKQIKWCDVALPLAGIAKPAYYLKKPLWTFELDFEQNLKIVRACVDLGKRLIFPSTSEVYGMNDGGELLEDTSPLTVGPVSKTRWIYSCSKQMMDRIIFAYGQERDLRFSIFRPFNWTGPRLDTFEDAKEGTARVVTQMIYDILNRGGVTLVGGGSHRRSFTWIGDATDALLRVIANDSGRADGEIFNIGNPANNCSIKELAETLIDEMKRIPAFSERASRAVLKDMSAGDFYGSAYDDMRDRVPSVSKIEHTLGWSPSTPTKDILRMTAEYYAHSGVL